MHYLKKYTWGSANIIKKQGYFLYEGKMRMNGVDIYAGGKQQDKQRVTCR